MNETDYNARLLQAKMKSFGIIVLTDQFGPAGRPPLFYLPPSNLGTFAI